MTAATLHGMAAGGIHDQLGGGFSRYSVDAAWTVPHFEKMLYDNALLARAYLHAWQATGEQRFLEVCLDTLGWALREMRGPEGGFFSARDADSEGVEGRFYVWRAAELRELLGEDAEAAMASSPSRAGAERAHGAGAGAAGAAARADPRGAARGSRRTRAPGAG